MPSLAVWPSARPVAAIANRSISSRFIDRPISSFATDRSSFLPFAGALFSQPLWKFRENLFFIKSEKPFLIRPDLVDPDVVETGFCILFELGDVAFGIWTANYLFCHVFFFHHLRRLLEMGRDGQHLRQFAGDSHIRPEFMGDAPRSRFVFVITHGDLAEARFALAAGLLELLERLLIGRSGA